MNNPNATHCLAYTTYDVLASTSTTSTTGFVWCEVCLRMFMISCTGHIQFIGWNITNNQNSTLQ